MPQIVGRKTAPNDAQSITDSLRSLGDSIYKPIDPVSQEKIKQLQMQAAARTNMIAALQRGDAIEYGAQAIQGGVPFDDALGYARTAGLIGPDWRPTQPLYVPSPQTAQPPTPLATGSNATATPQFAPQTNASSPWS
jgi:hypothetical protein